MTETSRVIALGFFDGVHIGHAALLERCKARARELGARPAVMSFDVHPDALVFGRPVELLNSAAGREEIIRRLFGIEDVIFLHFDRRIMRMDWRDFLRELIGELRVCHIVVGHDFRFGDRGLGTAELLRGWCAEHGIGCDVIPPVLLDGELVSSTHIRELVRDGRVEEAARWLGHPHTLSDTIRSGCHLGRRLGSPTINMRFPEGVLVPRHGVYAARVFPGEGESYRAVTNVGVRPTVSDGDQVSVESHLLDFSGDLYGRQVRLEFCAFLRDERRFADLEALSEQIRRDADAARAYFARADK